MDAITHRLEEMASEVRKIRRDVYGDADARQRGVFDRLDHLEESIRSLRSEYEHSQASQTAIERINEELDQLRLDYRIAIVYIRGIAAAVGTITVTLLGAAAVGILRVLGGA